MCALNRSTPEYNPIRILLSGRNEHLRDALDHAAQAGKSWKDGIRQVLGGACGSDYTLVTVAAYFWNGGVEFPPPHEIGCLDTGNRRRLLLAWECWLDPRRMIPEGGLDPDLIDHLADEQDAEGIPTERTE